MKPQATRSLAERPPTENQLLAKLLEAAPFALPNLRLFRRQVLHVEAIGRDGHRFRVAAAAKGQCDAYALLRGGRCIEIEAKARAGRLRPDQEAWRDFCRAWEIPWLMLKQEKGETGDETIVRWLVEVGTLARGLT
jgi:hypothetical protein